MAVFPKQIQFAVGTVIADRPRTDTYERHYPPSERGDNRAEGDRLL